MHWHYVGMRMRHVASREEKGYPRHAVETLHSLCQLLTNSEHSFGESYLPLLFRSIYTFDYGAYLTASYLTVDDAFTMLRSYCRERNLRLSEAARDIVTAPKGFPDLQAG